MIQDKKRVWFASHRRRKRVEKVQIKCQKNMSYRGRPSKGCQMCRSRKVKCDETKPTCNRCRDASHECIYRDDFDLFFRDQTESTARRAQKQRTRSQQPSVSPEPGSLTQAETSRKDTSRSPSIPPRPSKELNPTTSVTFSPELCQIVCDRFFFDYVLPQYPSDPCLGFLSGLPTLFQNSTQDSALRTAVTAVAFANFAGRMSSTECETFGLRYYVSALNLMGQAIQDPQEVQSVETLLTAYLLGLYEGITPGNTGEQGHSRITHKDGGSLLLSMKGPMQIRELIDLKFFGITYLQMLVNCVTEGKRPQLNIGPMANYLDSLPDFQTLNKLFSLIHRTAEIVADWKDYKELMVAPNTSLANHLASTKQLLGRALSLDSELEDWDGSVRFHGSRWIYQVMQIGNLKDWEQELMDYPGAPRAMHQYLDFAAPNYLNKYRASRIRLNGIILRLTQRMDTLSAMTSEGSDIGSSENQARAQALIQRLVDDICSSVLHLLVIPLPDKPTPKSTRDVCGIRGLNLLWPLVTSAKYLHLVGSNEAAEREQWTHQVLRFIRFDLGIGKAQVDLYESPEI